MSMLSLHQPRGRYAAAIDKGLLIYLHDLFYTAEHSLMWYYQVISVHADRTRKLLRYDLKIVSVSFEYVRKQETEVYLAVPGPGRLKNRTL